MSAVLSLADAERYCHDMARREAKNFYWGFISLPREQRNAIYALYDFARQVDDEADAVAHAPDLPGRLQRHRDRIAKCVRAEFADDDAVMQVLAVAVARFAIPERELQMLIDGVEMDGTKVRYGSWDELRSYCNLVASVVGRMCVRIFGFDDEAALERADDLARSHLSAAGRFAALRHFRSRSARRDAGAAMGRAGGIRSRASARLFCAGL
jgi:phytoene synthase